MGVQGFSGFVSRLSARCEDVLACEWSSDALSLEVQATHQRINTSMSSSTTRMCNRNKSVTKKSGICGDTMQLYNTQPRMAVI
jgi:hypothetical protein